MAISLIRKLPLDEALVKKLYAEILEIPALKGKRWDVTSPEIIEQVMIKIVDAVGDPDPFAAEKRQLNRTLMDRYPYFQSLVTESDDPLYTAVKLAIAGNAIDFMVPRGTIDVAKTIQEQLEQPISQQRFSPFKTRLEASKSILYFGDNAGEVVLDKLLIETIKKRYDRDITFVVRSVPTLNDVTIKEATFVGMDQVVRVVENGIDGPLPGTIFNRCASQIRALAKQADLIISKGGGNYDSLGEEKNFLNKIVFMLLSKCYPYNQTFGVDMFHPILSVSL
jgi:hypothetical protein